jgi:hypothetical protein
MWLLRLELSARVIVPHGVVYESWILARLLALS